MIAIALQADGKIIIGGSFTSYNGVARNRIARLNADGSLDLTFDPGTGADGLVHGIAIQSSGRIIIAGEFVNFNGVSRNRIAGLHADGSLDAIFDPGAGANLGLQGVAVQSGDKIVIAGFFTSFDGTARSRVARLNANGSLDTSFDPGSGPDGDVYGVVAPSGGKAIIGGPFHNYAGVSRNNVARINDNGSLDTAFDPGTGASSPGGGPDSFVYGITVQSGGRIVLGGFFSNFNGVSRSCIVGLTGTGSIDGSFDPGAGASNAIYTAAVQSDDKVILGGQLTSYNSTSSNHLARANAGGSLDSSFHLGTGANAELNSIAVQPDDKIIIGGGFTSYNGNACNHIARLNTDGSLDGTFNPPPDPALAPVITNPLDLHLLDINEAFNAVSNTWSARAPMPTARESIAMAEANGKIYVAGGEVYNNCTPINTFEAYDAATDVWRSSDPASIKYDSTLPAMPTRRWNIDAASVNGIVYIAGGSTGCPGTILDIFESYNPATNLWRSSNPATSSYDSSFPHMPTPRWAPGSVALGTRIYVIGGATEPNDAPLDTVEAYDTTNNTWSSLHVLNTPRASPLVAALNGKIYAIGGRTGVGVNSFYISTVEEYDPVHDSWTNKTSSIPTNRAFSAGIAVLNSAIYVMGGLSSITGNVISTVEAYHPERDGLSDAWTTEPPMPTARANCPAAVVSGNNILYAIGGANGGAATAGQPFVYQITATNHPTSYSASGLPAGLSFDNNLGIIYGTPTASIDAHPTFTATNANGTGSKTIRLFVQAAPTVQQPKIISSTCVTARTGHPFSFQVLTENPTSSARFTAGGFPYSPATGPQLSIDPITGLISGTPTIDGTFGVTLGVTDGPVTTSTTLQLTFVSDTAVPVITSSDNAILVPGQFFSRTITADSAATFSYIGADGIRHQGVSTQGLPAGLSFDGVATISGTYTGGQASNKMVLGRRKTEVELSGRTIRPNTLTIRPPRLLGTQLLATNLAVAGTRGLDFFQTTTFASWKEDFFTQTELNDVRISGDSADPDADGLCNLLEYALGTDPKTFSATNRPSAAVGSNYLSLTYTKVLAATDLTYSIEESVNLNQWLPVTPVNEILDDDGFSQTIRAQVSRSDAGSSGKLFLHLKVSR